MIDLNKVLIVGRLTRKPELRYLPSGTALAEFGIAYNRRFRTKDNEQKDEAHFFSVKTFGKSAEFAGEYLDKGKAVFVEGRLVQEKWEAQDGSSREKIVILADRVGFAESKAAEGGGYAGSSGDDQSGGGASRGGGYRQGGASGAAPSSAQNVSEEPAEGQTANDLPF